MMDLYVNFMSVQTQLGCFVYSPARGRGIGPKLAKAR